METQQNIQTIQNTNYMGKIKKLYNRIFSKSFPFWKYCRVWKELSFLSIALILWSYSAVFLRWIDPSAGIYDAGVFQVYLFAIIGICMLHAIVRLLMKLIWPTPEHYLAHQFQKDFKTITPWQKLKLATTIFFALLSVLTLLARTL